MLENLMKDAGVRTSELKIGLEQKLHNVFYAPNSCK
ncbi:predicted protein [Sclerotinia sclerotiorum 1980 UF-70]|uniref:Uncharacterized protein n=1 Tax=Sclerotinia sclerotiorum (strain ATCC 18683 / 1980 / Ss-1) TaxID=665079 RepID=A7EI53_SCLS1|nr:predicted protein [Sclerotinia sclerotiorum 1980 UF-70]EDO02519.1 predicted protein [Sclerotinia sclerotiorum 1980 UF-70]